MRHSGRALRGAPGLLPRDRRIGSRAWRDPPILWTPDEARVARATITRYSRWLAETRGLEAESYHDLWRWSVTDLEAFWASIWEFFDVRASAPTSASSSPARCPVRVVPRRAPQLRGARLPLAGAGHDRDPARIRAPAAGRDDVG